MFCIYSVTIQKSILMKRAVVLYLFCNNLEMNSYHREAGILYLFCNNLEMNSYHG